MNVPRGNSNSFGIAATIAGINQITNVNSIFNSNGKPQFTAEEKVLCYEPDPTKAKVLYDSKVLEVKSRRDNRGRKICEYLIHFQGWNSSWDRYVAEEFVLKDTEENRELQRYLNEKAQQLQQSLKKSKKKSTLPDGVKNGRMERRRCYSVPTPERDMFDSCSRSSLSDADDLSDDSDEDHLDSHFDEEDDGDPKETFPLVIPEEIKRRLEQDYELVTQDERLVKVPASPCVAQILEDYVKFYGLKELIEWAERVKHQESCPPPGIASIPSVITTSPPLITTNTKTQSKVKTTSTCTPSIKVEEPKWDELKHITKKINFVKEVVDGLRLMFDFLHERILVYKQETKQLSRSKAFHATFTNDMGTVLDVLVAKCNQEFQEAEFEKDKDKLDDEPPPAKRFTRMSKVYSRNSDNLEDGTESCASPRGRMSSSDSSCNISSRAAKKRSPSPDSSKRARHYISELLSWKLLPRETYDMIPPNPSLIYGVVHLMRLFVKMPEILSKTSIPRRRLRVLVAHINLLLSFVAKHDGSPDKRFLYYRNFEEQEMHEKNWNS